MYDAIVVGARVAGSPTAMLLARKGYRVLVVDRATFPSDTLSTHQLHIPGSLTLQRWGLLDQVLATDPGVVRRLRFDVGRFILEGEYPVVDGVGYVQSPRRTLLDKLLIDAAVEAGVEVREGFITEDLLWEDGQVAGIKGRLKSGGTATERAKIVVGADGKHSSVAQWVDTPAYDEHPPLTCAYYSYWEGVPVVGGEIYSRERRAISAWPTNDGLTMIYVAWPMAEFDAFRANVEGSYMASIDRIPHLAERVRQGRRVERIMGTADMPNFYRKPYGAGWALVGDAGYAKDPITGLGISDAFRDAERLSEAIDTGLSGQRPIDAALADYEQARNRASRPMYQQTLDIARMAPPAPEQIALFAALEHNPAETSRFFGVLSGAVEPSEFFAPRNLFRIIGPAGMAKIMMSRMFSPQRQAG